MPYAPRKRYTTRRRTVRPTRTTRGAPRKTTRSYRASRAAVPRRRGHIVGNTRATVQRGYLPFGRAYFAKLPYVENFAITASGTTGLSAINYTFSANDSYDPRRQVGGHQPLQYDAMSVAYDRVWDHGCKVILEFSNPTADGLYVGYRVRSSENITTTAGQTIDWIQEMRESICCPINNTGSQTKKFSFYVPNYKVFGITKQQYANLEYSHPTTGTTAGYVLIEPYAINTVAGDNTSVRVNIKLIYYSQFTNSQTLPQS